MRKFYLAVILIMLWATAHPSWAAHPITSAQFTESGMIHVVMDDGRQFDVPDDPANRHRQMVAEWVNSGNAVAPAAPAPKPTRLEKIRRDPSYPSTGEFMEAQIHCRYDLDCSALDALYSRIKLLESQYP